MDQEVAKTLSSLELKLAELEQELTSIGRREPAPEPPNAPGRLIDEAVEQKSSLEADTPPSASPPPPGPYLEAHQPFEPPAVPQAPSFEERRQADTPQLPAFEQRGQAEPPAPQPPAFEERQSIDIADLVRFRDKLAHTMDELIDEYSRLLSLQPPASPRGLSNS